MALGYQHPYADTNNLYVSKRVFLQATKDIKDGEELFVKYGSTYAWKYFATEGL